MRIIYLIVTSSLMICLMLLFRRLFRNKLSANVIYTLWLLVFFRLLVPFGYWEMPVFGAPAEIVYRPMAIVEQFFKEQVSESIPVYEEAHKIEIPVAEAPASAEGIKIYDSVIPEAAAPKQESEPEENNITPTVSKEHSIALKTVILSIWFTGCMCAAGYVIPQNLKLRKKIDEMDVIEQIDGIDICISKDIKTPCLFGLRNPKIVVTEEVLADPILYKYAVTHELEHYHHKDHIYNADRISMCILYWWNPLVWYAAKCVSEDAELACDERVLKNKSTEERKNYGYALLKMIENAQCKPLFMATSYFGGKNTTKQRIEAITRKTTTKKYVLFPVALLLIVLLVVGCMYPSEKSYIKTNGKCTNSETEELKYIESKYEYSLQDEFQSMLFYYETYEYGELIQRRILSYGDLEKNSDAFLLRNEFYKYEENDAFVLKMDGIETSMPISKFPANTQGISSPHLEKELLEIKPGDDLILMAAYQSRDSDITNISCEVMVIDDEKLTESPNKNNVVTFARLILSDLPAETLCEQMQAKEFPIEGESLLPLDEYNEKYENHGKSFETAEIPEDDENFYTEPDKNKVCLAVMPDGISKAGGDYRYIIPEDQVKWTDHYKQARSLAVDGAWKDGEHSAGIWIVFNDEWTCITEQGMIFDFDKRAEKEEIKDFYNLCLEEAKKYGTGTPINPENFPEIVSATLNYNGAYTVTDESVLRDLRKVIYTSKELRSGGACPFTASLVLELKDKGYETIYLATDSCSAWLTDGVYYEYFGYENIEEILDIFRQYGVKVDTNEVVLKSEND